MNWHGHEKGRRESERGGGGIEDKMIISQDE